MLCQVSSEATYQRIHHQKLCLVTSDSDTCSEGRFVRRTFSATMIEIHHHLTTQKLENQPYPQNSNVSTIVRTFYLKWTILHFQVGSYTKVTDMVRNCTITSWRNLLQRIQFQGAPPLIINRSGSEVLYTEQLSNLKELLLCENHSVNKTT
ncbi:hypothetical protein QL285_096323 [Trifolium repens]|nr:hypothetical protein QL285_096323 [Trifolium repens]